MGRARRFPALGDALGAGAGRHQGPDGADRRHPDQARGHGRRLDGHRVPRVPGGAKAADAAVMLFRVRSDSVVRIRDGQQGFQFGDFYAYSKICTHVGCPVVAVRAADRTRAVPVPPVAVQSLRGHVPGLRTGHPPAAAAADRARRRGILRGSARTSSKQSVPDSGRTASSLRGIPSPRRQADEPPHHPHQGSAGPSAVQKASWTTPTSGYHGARPLRTALNKVFPSHWSFMLGEAALYSFIVLLLSGCLPDAVLRRVDGRDRLQRASTRSCAACRCRWRSRRP